MQHSALVVIDLQNDITKNYKKIIEKVNTAIDWAVKKNLWVIYIQHNNLSAGTRTFKPGTRGAELVPEMNVVSEHIFTKTKSNALTSEAFTAFLKEHGITDFYIWCCTIKVDIGNSKSQYIEKDKQEATKDGSESTEIQHGI